MKEAFVVVTAALGVLLVMACGGLSNEEACQKLESLCNGADAGTGVRVTCQPNTFDAYDSDLKDCIDKATTCNAAVACAMAAKH